MNAFSIPPIAMATLMVYVGFYHFLIYYRQQDNRENLTFALSCLGVGLYAVLCAGLYNASSPDVGVEWQRFQVVTLAALAIVFLWFIADFTDHTNRKVVRWFTIYYLIAALAGLFIRSDLTWTSIPSIKEIQLPFENYIRYNEMTPGVLTNLHSIVGLIYFIYILMVSLKFYKSGNKKKGLYLLIAISMLFVGNINDTFVSSGFYNFIYILEYSYIGMILVFTFFLTNKVIKAGDIKSALLVSEEKYRNILNTMEDEVYICSPEFVLEYMNPAMKKRLGKDVTNDYCYKEIYGKNEICSWCVFEEVKKNEVINHELKNSINQRDYYITNLAIPGAKGRTSKLTIARDITERKQLEKTLQDSERNMASVLNNTQDAVVRIDKNLRHIFANPTIYETTGLSAEQYIGKTNEEIGMPEELCSFWQEKHEAVFQTGKLTTFEFDFPTANKGERIFQAVITPEFNDSGDVETIISFMRDITDLKRAEAEKSATITKLEKTLTEVKTLRGLIPICSQCKKIRDDKGYWNTLEAYIEKHSDASFSHGMCQQCSDELYGDEDWYIKMKKGNGL